MWWHRSGSTLGQIVFFAWWHQAIIWTKDDLSSLREILHKMFITAEMKPLTFCTGLNVVSVRWPFLLLRSKFIMHILITACCIRLCVRMPCSVVTPGHSQTRQKFQQFHKYTSQVSIWWNWLHSERWIVYITQTITAAMHWISLFSPVCGDFHYNQNMVIPSYVFNVLTLVFLFCTCQMSVISTKTFQGCDGE